jgi:hypothetical protein
MNAERVKVLSETTSLGQINKPAVQSVARNKKREALEELPGLV